MSTRKSATNTKTTTADGFTAEERIAMKERAQELKATKRGSKKADGEAALQEKIAEMSGSDRDSAKRLHAIITENAPELSPKTWYGMPAWALDGKVLCFFQSAAKFKSRYATFGFNDVAKLDDGTLWPTAFALTTLTPEHEATIADLVRKAVR